MQTPAAGAGVRGRQQRCFDRRWWHDLLYLGAAGGAISPVGEAVARALPQRLPRWAHLLWRCAGAGGVVENHRQVLAAVPGIALYHVDDRGQIRTPQRRCAQAAAPLTVPLPPSHALTPATECAHGVLLHEYERGCT